LKLGYPLLARIPTPLDSEAEILEKEGSDAGAQQAEPQQRARLCCFAAEPRQIGGFRGNLGERRLDLWGGGFW